MMTRRELCLALAGHATAGLLGVAGTGCVKPASTAPAPRPPGEPSPTSAPPPGAIRAPSSPAPPGPGLFPVLEATGSHRDIGFAIGRVFRDRIAATLAEQSAFETVRTAARGDQRHKVAAYEQAARAAFPQLIEELQGMADGCGVPFPALFAWNCRSEIQASAEPCPPGCSTVGWADADGVVLAHNEDGAASYVDRMFVLRARPPSGIGFAAVVYPGTLAGNGPGLNTRGVVQTTNYIAPCDTAQGLPRYFIGRAVLEARDLEHALSIATTEPRAFPWHHNLASLVDRRLVSLETWPGRHHRREVRGLHLHTNHLIHPQMLDLPERGDYLERSSLPRLRRLQEQLDGRNRRSRAELEAALEDRGGSPCKVCRRPGDEVPGATVARAVFQWPHRRMDLTGGVSCGGPEQSLRP